ncbi:UNVERIFIED_CONTAM: hypothetical protein PYX00_000045 [Menopon gallinae]|uniref:Uncharacterized protein n=1 Tax=Menopon gallinae TaxID=328185 RepID=A0AAW2I8B4_9NEOP
MSHHSDTFNISDLTPEQQKLLIDIRRRKQELLLEIQKSKFARLDKYKYDIMIDSSADSFVLLSAFESYPSDVLAGLLSEVRARFVKRLSRPSLPRSGSKTGNPRLGFVDAGGCTSHGVGSKRTDIDNNRP